jgi:prepilin-type N-terminal cleavage/methylation domain-containing protein
MILNRPKIKKTIGNESGFTLLEILAVIVILGILGVVAVPKYFNLQAQARERSMAAVEAEVISRVNGFFAQSVLSGDAPAAIVYDDSSDSLGFANHGLGDDFLVTVSSGGGAWGGDPETETPPPIVINLSIDPAANSALSGAAARDITIPRPGL